MCTFSQNQKQVKWINAKIRFVWKAVGGSRQMPQYAVLQESSFPHIFTAEVVNAKLSWPIEPPSWKISELSFNVAFISTITVITVSDFTLDGDVFAHRDVDRTIISVSLTPKTRGKKSEENKKNNGKLPWVYGITLIVEIDILQCLDESSL